ncbi:MAG: hypothetical protein FD129_3092 [bacterium]|nr:MAG: hypothetical protein FD129_3092 [bacterium]
MRPADILLDSDVVFIGADQDIDRPVGIDVASPAAAGPEVLLLLRATRLERRHRNEVRPLQHPAAARPELAACGRTRFHGDQIVEAIAVEVGNRQRPTELVARLAPLRRLDPVLLKRHLQRPSRV